MIGLIRGSVVLIEGGLVLVDVGGVGYEVQVPENSLSKLVELSTVVLYTRQIFREDGVTLCGFTEKFERKVFDLLLDVKGCGPKVALALIAQVGADAVIRAIAINDAKTLCIATGVGLRLAERILLELRNKVEAGVGSGGATAPVSPINAADRDLIDALVVLGYRRQEIDAVLPQLAESADDGTKLKHALQLLKKS